MICGRNCKWVDFLCPGMLTNHQSLVIQTIYNWTSKVGITYEAGHIYLGKVEIVTNDASLAKISYLVSAIANQHVVA